MTATTINVLVFEDNPADVIFLREALTQDALNTFALTVVERLADGLPLLASHSYEVVLLDLGLPDSRGLATFERVQQAAPDLPIVIFSGNADEEAAVLAVRAGAQEYVVKGPLGYAVTGRTIRHAIERQNLRQSLQASEQRFSIAFHASPAAQAITALDSQQLVDVNEAYCRLTGYARGELIGHTSKELKLWIEADRQAVLQLWQGHGRVRDVELNLQTRSGEIRTVLASLAPLDLNGQPCVISTVLDITERKRAEVQLRESEVLLRQVLESNPDSTFALDRDYRLLIDNQRHQHELIASSGHPFEVGEPMLSSDYPAEVLDFWRAAYDRALAGETFNLEGSWVDLNGQLHTHENLFTPLRDATGAIIGVLVVAHDITARKRVAEALALTSKTLAEAQKIAHLGSFEYIVATQTTVWSEEEYHIYGLDPTGPSPAYDVMLHQCIHPDDAALLNETFTRAIQNYSVYELEHRIVRPDGSVRWVYDRAHPYFDEHGELVRYLGTTLDITERKQAEAAMRQWADAFEHCAHGIALGDPVTNRILVCNPAFARLHHCAASDLIGNLILSVYAPADRDHVQASIAEADRSGQVQYEARMLRRDGSTFPVQMDVVSVRAADGRLLYRVATAQDITERKQAETALRKSEAKFRSYIENSPLAIFEMTAAGRYRTVNRAAQDLLGYDLKMLSDLTLPDLIADEDHEAAMQGFVELQANKVMVAELRLKRRTGEQVWVILRAVRINDDTYLAFCADITERKHAEVALRESQEKYRSLLESLDSVVAMLDDEGHFLYMNEVAARSLGGTPDQFIGQTMHDLFPEPVATQQLQHIQQVIRTDQAIVNQSESIIQGQSRWYRTSIQPVHDALGRTVQALLNSTDITAIMMAQRQLEDVNRTLEERVARRTLQLAAANERLTELDQLKSKFVSDVTHELRTPVTSLSLYIDLLAHGKPDKREQYIAKLQDQMARLHKLINDILDLSRLERKHEETNRFPVDLNAIAEHVSAMERSAAESAGLTLTCDVSEALPPVMVRPDQLTRAVTNLVSNAVKYTLAGGIQVRTFQQGQRVCLQVTDTGRGIPADELPHIFSRFYRGREVAQSKIPGTGLGLAIVKEIIEAHGGTVEVESQSGVGSTFQIWLPVGVNDPQ